jgi:DNA-binding PadR family transcriptional regulator
MDIARDIRRGAMRLLVLHYASLHEVSGVWMAEQLARRGYRISPGSLYPLLHELEDTGLLTSARKPDWGALVRFYRLTPAGREALVQARLAFAELAEELGTAAQPALGRSSCLETPETREAPETGVGTTRHLECGGSSIEGAGGSWRR